MEQTNRKTRPSRAVGVGSILMRIALVSFCLVLLSVHLMSGLFAKYTSNGEGGDEARVAAFKVNVVGGPASAIEVTCTDYNYNTGTYTITVTNRSEVAVKYTMRVEMANTAGVTPTFSNNGTGTLAVGGTNWETLTFTVDWAQFTASETGAEASANIAFTVYIDVVQID